VKSKSRQDPAGAPAARALRNIPAKPAVPEPEVQEGRERGAARDERTKRVLKRHSKRDEPLIDSVEPDETP
jgi:hypothetical protein